MYVLAMSGPGGAWRRLPFVRHEVMLGRDAACDVVIDDAAVDPRHARLVVKDGKYILVDLKSATGTRLNGKPLRAPVIVRASEDRIAIGRWSIAIRDATPPAVATNFPVETSREGELLAAVARGDAGADLVYADWLEQEGDLARAEFLRLQGVVAADGPDAAGAGRRLLELCLDLDARWRARVARPPVERCVESLTCPRQWQAMIPTASDGIRHCTACKKDVYYCVSVPEAKARAREGACVALDLTSLRRRNDLDVTAAEVCRACEREIGFVSEAPVCPHCGEDRTARREMMVVGRLPIARD